MFTNRASRKSCRPPLQPVPTEAAGHIGIGCNRVLVFGLSDVMMSIKSIDVHIGHESSVGVCSSKITRIALHRIASGYRCVVFASSTLGGGSVAISSLVLVFATTHKEMALQVILYNPIRKTKCQNYRCICQNRKK